MPTSAKQARSASFVLAYELETVRCNRERELDRIELAVRSLCPEQTRNGDLRRLPEPKLALCVFWAAGRTPAGQMALFSPASAGLFFGSRDEPACKRKRERHAPSGCHHRHVHAGSDQPGLYR